MTPPTPQDAAETLLCSFCGKTNHDVGKLLAGPTNANICNECVALCADICAIEMAVPSRRGVPWDEIVERLEAFNRDYGIDRAPNLRQLSDMCFALGAEPNFGLRDAPTIRSTAPLAAPDEADR